MSSDFVGIWFEVRTKICQEANNTYDQYYSTWISNYCPDMDSNKDAIFGVRLLVEKPINFWCESIAGLLAEQTQCFFIQHEIKRMVSNFNNLSCSSIKNENLKKLENAESSDDIGSIESFESAVEGVGNIEGFESAVEGVGNIKSFESAGSVDDIGSIKSFRVPAVLMILGVLKVLKVPKALMILGVLKVLRVLTVLTVLIAFGVLKTLKILKRL